MDEATKAEIVAFIEKKTERGKGLNTMRDITKSFKSHPKPEVRKAVQDLIAEEKLAYWSSGSTTYIRLASYEPGSEGLTDN